MKTTSRPKVTIMFPNSWAVNSFLLRLKRSTGWEFIAATNGTHFKLKPQGALDYILIGLNKACGRNENATITAEINAEKLGRDLDLVWDTIFDLAKRYRC